MTEHPYRGQPTRAFWSRAVSPDFVAAAMTDGTEPLLRSGDSVVSAGSCFAANMIPWLEGSGLVYVRTEEPHPAFAHLPENLGYRSFSAAYGNVYTARHLRQLWERANGDFQPLEDRWHEGGRVIDPFRPGLGYPARSDEEFDILTRQHLDAVLEAFNQATVFVFTLGLTEAWESTLDGAVYPACPGTVAGQFDPDRHRFHNFSAEEVRADLVAFIGQLRETNPGVRVILTVSPVPLIATATDQHVVVASSYSKAVLRVAAAEVAASTPQVSYFPALEIVTGPQAPHDYLAEDRRSVTQAGVRAVMETVIAASDLPQHQAPLADQRPVLAPQRSPEMDISRRIAEADCDEVLVES
jgi:GSCFA family